MIGLRLRVSVSLIAVLFLVIFQEPAFAEEKKFYNLEAVESKNVFLGDVLTIGSQNCWQSSKPGTAQSKIRLEIFENNKWTPVGKVRYLRNSDCPKKYPFEQKFVWEVDRIGLPSDEYSQFGILRLRNRAAKPTVYVKMTIFESLKSFEDFQQQRASEAGAILNCMLSGGQWNSQSRICVKN